MRPNPNTKMTVKAHIIAVLSSLALTVSAHAELVSTYVGIDGRAVLPSGTYAGLPNPNAGRLTFLHAHEIPDNLANNHYHGIGAYTYAGSATAPVTTNSNAGNRIPEVYTGLPGLTLIPSTNPVFAGRLASGRTAEQYSDLRMRSVQDLAKYGFGSSEQYMFLSSGGTRTNRLDGAVIALELVSKSEGLSIGDTSNVSLASAPGDRITLGDGNSLEFLPVFSVPATASEGTYSASFKLVDIGTGEGHVAIPESGVFHLDFRVAPAPAMAIRQTVTLTMPLVTVGYTLEGASSLDGSWTAVAATPEVEYTGSGESRTATGRATLTLPVGEGHAFFRFRRQ